MKLPQWWQDWSGETCVIVASGPTARDVPIEKARGLAHFIAINESWRLAPWAEILLGCDASFWDAKNGVPEYSGIKLCLERGPTTKNWGINFLPSKRPDDRIVLNEEIGKVGWGGNSGFNAFNLAIQFGCRKVILVGYDMRIDYGVHWHGKHAEGMGNPTRGNAERWRRAMDAAAKPVRDHGVMAINCSPISALQNYPKMTFEEALAA